jgi:predicted AAA+ superfamily ATPase
MFTRSIKVNKNKSFLLLGPRGTGKSTWIRQEFSGAIFVDLLDPESYTSLLASPGALNHIIPKRHKDWVVIDEIQRVPELLNVVHQLIESRKLRFALTGSSARKLRRSGTNLLAGRALTYKMFPMTAAELGDAFDLKTSLRSGHLPSVFSETDPGKYLASYVQTYLREEVFQEGLTRNIAGFSRFLQAASYSQAATLNITDVARDCEVDRKVVEGYFSILEDLQIASRLPVFTKRAKRKTVAHPKFYFFDTGVYQAIRPKGPLDHRDVIPGAALETLVFQELSAVMSYLDNGDELYYWRTTAKQEVDFIVYGPSGLVAIEVKSNRKLDRADLRSLREFRADYPIARCFAFYGGEKNMEMDGIQILPVEQALRALASIISNSHSHGRDS